MAAVSVSNKPPDSQKYTNEPIRLRKIAEQLALRLARVPDDPALASLYDDVIEKLQQIEGKAQP